MSGYKCIVNLDFKSDPCNIKNYLIHRISNNEISGICNFSTPFISPNSYSMLQECIPTSVSVERSFSMLKKLLALDRNFIPENIYNYFAFYFNKETREFESEDGEYEYIPANMD